MNSIIVRVVIQGEGFESQWEFQVETDDVVSKAFDIIDEIVSEAEIRSIQDAIQSKVKEKAKKLGIRVPRRH
ncbi:MAG: hypothetical protein OEZ48_00025 [Candidatus Bathyarchaeota archaeon]|nr:hypothetical protein [Candidatus Bathyarchaeota archaeon]MDH5686242.1 hypothetical protein [Candidatus Bathyarchaeota archaeon]